MADKWYNSEIAEKAGVGLIILALGMGGASFLRGCGESCRSLAEGDAIEKRAINGPRLQEADLNGNGIVDKFYVIDGKISVVELDGKPVSDLYKR
jgi:hypothetical protein